MSGENPFEKIFEKLEQIERTLILSVNKPIPKPIESDPNRIIDLPEAARLLRKPVGTVRGYIHSRNLPATLVGKSYLIKYQDLVKWFEEFQQPKTKVTNTATAKMITIRQRHTKI
jgi:excisionase family DNA binding protein